MLPLFEMKIPTLFLCFSALWAKAELPVITEEMKWLGYFVAWDDKYYDYGFGDDGKGKMHFVKGKERLGHTDFVIYCKVQEQLKGKWVTRKLAEENGLTSESKGGRNLSEPVSVTFTVTGGTKVEFMQVKSKGQMIIKPKILEKGSENPIRAVVELSIPDIYKHSRRKEQLTARELKKELRSDTLSAVRADDGKKIKVKLYDIEIDILGEDYLKKGAREIEFKSSKIGGRSLNAGQGSDDVGILEIKPSKKLYEGMKILWIPDESKLSDKDCYFTFSIN